MDRFFYLEAQDWNDGSLIGTAPIKYKNRGEILKSLIFDGKQSRADLARKTGLSAPTVTRIISELLESGTATEEGILQTKDRGSPPSIVSFNKTAGYVIGVDIGESIIRIALSDLSRNVIDIEEIPTKAKVGGGRTAEQIAAGICRIIKNNKITKDMLWNICVGVPGTVQTDKKGTVTVNAPDIKDWLSYPLHDVLEERLGIKEIHFENAQNLAVICEHAIGCAREYSDVVFIQVQAGIGSGIMIGGKLYRGYDGKAGEIGFMMPDLNCPPPDKQTTEARHGTLEMKIGIKALLKQMGTLPEELDNPEEIPNLEQLYQLAADGEKRYFEVIKNSWDYLGQVAVNISSVICPQLIVLGGDIMPLGDQVRETVTRYVRMYCLNPPRIELSTQGKMTCMLGAVRLACEYAYQRLGVF